MRVVFAALLLIAGCGLEGLHNANPKLSMRINPATKSFDVTSNRDDNVSVTGLEAKTAQGGEFKVASATFSGNASSVREANVRQMEGMALQGQVAWTGATQLVGSLTELAETVLPFVPKTIAAKALGKVSQSREVSTPWGTLVSGGGLTPEQVERLMAVAGSALPATQPQ
jgi:hypothetical protein